MRYVPWALVVGRGAIALTLGVGLVAGKLTCAVGTFSHLEGIAISCTLREHLTDVRTWPHALRLRTATGHHDDSP